MSDYEDNTEDNHLDEHLDETLPEEEDVLSEFTESSPPSPPPSNEESINQLTLQLLLNTNSYKKYMAKVQSKKKEVRPMIEDLELYIGNIEHYVSASLEKVLNTGELHVEPMDPTYDMCESFRIFLTKSIEYYNNLANIKVKKIQANEKNYDQMNMVEKEHLTFLKVKKSEDNKNSLTPINTLNIDHIGLFPHTTPGGTFMFPPPPLLKRSGATPPWKTYGYTGDSLDSTLYNL
jgi:hypothetical protein